MTTTAHLDDTQLLEGLEGERNGQLDAAAASHLAGCRTCSDRIDELRAVMESVARVDVPEPSPLFWDHFPARVSRAIDAAPQQAGWLSASRWLWGSAVTAAVVLVLMLLPLGREASAPAPTATPEAPIATASPDTEAVNDGLDRLESLDGLEGDEAWEMVRAVAEASEYEEVQESGLAPRAGSLERAALDLNDDERAELARLVTQEIQATKGRDNKRTGASTP